MDVSVILRKKKKIAVGSEAVLSILHLVTAVSAEHWKSEHVPFLSSDFTGIEPRTLSGNSLYWMTFMAHLSSPLSTSEASGRKSKDRKNYLNEWVGDL